MDEFEKIQQLIRLKKYESPGEDFVEDFAAKFQERQRGEMLKQPAITLFWEQVKMYFNEAPAQKWALAAAAVAVLASVAWLIVPRTVVPEMAGNNAGPAAMSISLATDQTGKTIPAFSIETIRIMGEIEIDPDPGLLSKHFTGGYEQFIIVPHEKSGSSIAVPYEFVNFDRKPDIR